MVDTQKTDHRERAALTRRERKKRETRRRIYSAAFELFLEKGFDETTVEQIADRADVAKGTVFNYFPHKTSFLAALADDWLARMDEEFGPIERMAGTTRELLARVFFFLADLAVENPVLAHQALFESLRSMYDGVVEQEESIRNFKSITLSLLREGLSSGEVRSDLDVEHVSAMMGAIFHETMVRWFRNPGSVHALHDEIAARLDIMFDGLAPR
jgi:AcrR family transcriptional regulator